MDKKTVTAWIILMALIGQTQAQSYIVVSGNTLTANTQSNIIVDYDLSKYDPNLEPGDTGTLALVIRNTGTQDANDVELIIQSTQNIKIDKKFFLGTVKYGAPATVSLTYVISKNAEVGQHSIPILLTYDGKNSDGNTISNVKSNYDYPIKVYGNPMLSIKYLQAGEARIGEDLDIKVTIMNMKTKAFNAVATLTTPTNLVTVLGSNKVYLGEVDASGTADIAYRLHLSDALTSGAYSIPLRLDYENKGHSKHSEAFDIGLYVSGKPDVAITETQTDPEEANPGDEDVEVKVKVENIGTQEVKNLKVSLNSKAPFKESKSYLQTKDLGTLKASDSSTVSFFVDVDEKTKEGIYDLNFRMDYVVGTQKQNKTEKVRVVIKEKPDFKLETNDVTGQPGSKSEMRVNVTNTGKDCESVTVWVLKKSDHPFDFDDKSQLVGDLDSGESGEALLSFKVEDNAKDKQYLLPLEIRCSKDGKVYISSDNAKITVEQPKNTSQWGNLALFGALGLAAIVAYAIIRARKMGKREKK